MLNNFYATEVEIDLPLVYQNGQILLSNYEDVEVSEKILLKPSQTLAIYVNIKEEAGTKVRPKI